MYEKEKKINLISLSRGVNTRTRITMDKQDEQYQWFIWKVQRLLYNVHHTIAKQIDVLR